MLRKMKIEVGTSCNPVRERILIVRSSSSIYFNELSEMLVILDLRKSPAHQERRKLVTDDVVKEFMTPRKLEFPGLNS